MIEVEKRFALDTGNLEKLTRGAKFLSEKTFTDIYYDTPDFSLTKTDTWLRSRDGTYQLKVSLDSSVAVKLVEQYQELETDREISEHLRFDATVPLAENLREHRYLEFCRITTRRKKYKKDEFVIDIDFVDFGYETAEIELMVNDVSEVKSASERIVAYAKSVGLKEGLVRGKVLEYLRRNNPEHLQALIDAKVNNLYLMAA